MNKRQLKKLKNKFRISNIQRLKYKENDLLIFSLEEALPIKLEMEILKQLKFTLNSNNILILHKGISLEKVVSDFKLSDLKDKL